MRNGAKDRAETLVGIRNLVRIVREKTINGFVLSGVVFKGIKDGNIVPLHIECGVSNENSLGIFILANFLHVDDSRGNHRNGKFVKWCGPENLSLDELTKKFIRVRDEHKATRQHKNNTVVVKKVNPVEEDTTDYSKLPFENNVEIQPSYDILTQEYVPISREEFRKNHYGNPKDKSLKEMLPMLNEIYKHTKFIPKTLTEVLRIEVPRTNGVLEVIDIRDLFVFTEKDSRNSVLSVKLLVDMHIMEKNGNYYHWIGEKPTTKMVTEICIEFAYLNYIVAEKRKFYEAKAIAERTKKAEEKRLADEAELAQVTAEIEAEKVAEKSKVGEDVKPNLHQKVFEVSTNNVNLADLKEMTDRELMILICQRLQAIEEYQEKQSKNLVTVAEILSKTTV